MVRAKRVFDSQPSIFDGRYATRIRRSLS